MGMEAPARPEAPAGHNGNSACIQCGVCVQVCPMEVLSITEREVKLEVACGDLAVTQDLGSIAG